VRTLLIPAALIFLVVAVSGISEGAARKDTVDLLARVDLRYHVMCGEWTREADSLVSTTKKTAQGGNTSRFTVPVKLPKEFELTLVAERLDDVHAIGINLLHRGRRFNVSFDRWSSTKTGIGPIDGVEMDKNPLLVRQNYPVFPTGIPVTLVMTVRKDGLSITADRRNVLHVPGPLTKLGRTGKDDDWDDETLSIGTWLTAFRIMRLELKTL
jgi:hypothetical protein